MGDGRTSAGGSHRVQLAIDCREPHVLADWWAETLGWEVEEQDEAFIRSMVEQGHAEESDTARHRGRLVWRSGAAVNPPSALTAAPRLFFQEVPEPKAGKNRVHLDIRPDTDDLPAYRDALVARGATVLHEGRQGPHTWVTMADPEGNEFCV
jgi:hypothetical protein